ncbi:hypothetical protein RND81_02G248600 [Saponaria officinalis]|uniref:Uncharacterized protein n=1 Tax=Saponaria officinalis TaxID=3572 RepID=A0AAW1MWZ9_SAPOF
MKLNKSKNKGKIHPSPSSSSSSSSPIDPVSNLSKLLPATILALISVLSLHDKEVLAYMISHSLSSSFDSSSSSSSSASSKTLKKVKGKKAGHNIPSFDCGCFDCYTSYWFRWDSSPHRELIHQAIEAFEEHLAVSELQSKKIIPKSSRRRENNNNNNSSKLKKFEAGSSETTPAVVEKVEEESPEVVECLTEKICGGDDVEEIEGGVHEQQKGLARKVLPDVIGLFNSRLWNLWGPNV